MSDEPGVTSRRRYLGALAGVVVGSAGCLESMGEESSTATSTPTPTATPSPTPEPFDSIVGRWERYQADNQFTGYSGDYGPEGEPRIAWRFQASRAVGSPVVADGRVFFGDHVNAVIGLDARTGGHRWDLVDELSDSGLVNGLAIREDELYASINWDSTKSRHYALDFDGNVRWQTDDLLPNRNVPTVTDDHLFVVSTTRHHDDELFAYDLETGEQRWQVGDEMTEQYESRDYEMYGPVVYDDLLYVVYDDRLAMIEPTTGDPQWVKEVEAGYSDAYPTVAHDTLYTCHDDTVVATDPVTGEQLWATTIGPEADFSVAVDDDLVYAVTVHGVHALDAASGEQQWSYAIENNSETRTPPVVGLNTVYFGVENTLYAIDTREGRERWALEFENAIPEAPAIVGNKLFVGVGNELLALGPE